MLAQHLLNKAGFQGLRLWTDAPSVKNGLKTALCTDHGAPAVGRKSHTAVRGPASSSYAFFPIDGGIMTV